MRGGQGRRKYLFNFTNVSQMPLREFIQTFISKSHVHGILHWKGVGRGRGEGGISNCCVHLHDEENEVKGDREQCRRGKGEMGIEMIFREKGRARERGRGKGESEGKGAGRDALEMGGNGNGNGNKGGNGRRRFEKSK